MEIIPGTFKYKLKFFFRQFCSYSHFQRNKLRAAAPLFIVSGTHIFIRHWQWLLTETGDYSLTNYTSWLLAPANEAMRFNLKITPHQNARGNSFRTFPFAASDNICIWARERSLGFFLVEISRRRS